MFVDRKGIPYTIQKSEFIEVNFSGGVFIVPDDFLGGFISAGSDGNIRWIPLHQEGNSSLTENFEKGDSICRPRKILAAGTTASDLRIWI